MTSGDYVLNQHHQFSPTNPFWQDVHGSQVFQRQPEGTQSMRDALVNILYSLPEHKILSLFQQLLARRSGNVGTYV